MRRALVAAIASLLFASLIAPAVAAAPATTDGARGAKVVVIVGPAGAATNRYRAQARSAAALARNYTPDVTEIYSPNATWPAVRKALQGASLVIYMGHGNGWPSKYRDSLYPPTQNGFGLNPTAPGNDYSHQYFGEGPIADDVRLAKNAVVLLNHLCYASGNTEPGSRRGHPRAGPPARRQLRGGLHQGRGRGGDRRGVRQPQPHGPGRARRQALHRSRLARRTECQRPPVRLRERAQPRVRRPDGPRADQLRVLALDRAQGGPRLGGRPAQRPRNAAAQLAPQRRLPMPSRSSRASPARASSSRPRSSRAPPRSTASSGSRSRSAIADREKLPTGLQASVRWDLLEPVASDPGAEVAAPEGESTTGAAVPQIVAPDFGLISAERPGDVVAPIGPQDHQDPDGLQRRDARQPRAATG